MKEPIIFKQFQDSRCLLPITMYCSHFGVDLEDFPEEAVNLYSYMCGMYIVCKTNGKFWFDIGQRDFEESTLQAAEYRLWEEFANAEINAEYNREQRKATFKMNNELRERMFQFNEAMQRLNEYWLENKSDELDHCLSKHYPFTECFNEMTSEASEWMNNTTDEFYKDK
jgi:hypothetical protein